MAPESVGAQAARFETLHATAWKKMQARLSRGSVNLRTDRDKIVAGSRRANPPNGFVESFNGRLRDECLDEEVFASLAEARGAIERWRLDYNRMIEGLTRSRSKASSGIPISRPKRPLGQHAARRARAALRR